MAAMQMNVRIDARTKERGDAVLLEAGYSPTQTVRTVWAFAAAHAHEPQVVRSLLQQMEDEHDPGRETRIASKKAALRRMNELREQLEAVVGPSTNNPVAHLPYKELRSQALLGHWKGKGLL